MSIEKPTIKYEWSVKDVPNLSRIHNGRRLTIAPGQVKIVLDRFGPCVYIVGRTIKANGEFGQHRRAHWFEDEVREWSSAAPMSELPGWAQKYLDYVLTDVEIRRQP